MAIAVIRLVRNLHCRSHTIRTIMTTSSKAQKAMEKLEKNPYFEKYAGRIAELQKSSPEEFLKRVEAQEQKETKKKNPTSQYSSVLNPKQPISEPTAVEDKKLEAIFKVELVVDKSAEEIKTIWEAYHKDKEVICATVPNDIYQVIRDNVRQHPTFLFPLPRDQGYEFMMCQSIGHSVHFTPLLAYQVHKENAPECLTMVHYTELSEKGIILMRGDYDNKVLSGREAQCLANQFQMYYSGYDEEKTKLLESFTKNPDTFKYMDLISQLENIQLA